MPSTVALPAAAVVVRFALLVVRAAARRAGVAGLSAVL